MVIVLFDAVVTDSFPRDINSLTAQSEGRKMITISTGFMATYVISSESLSAFNGLSCHFKTSSYSQASRPSSSRRQSSRPRSSRPQSSRPRSSSLNLPDLDLPILYLSVHIPDSQSWSAPTLTNELCLAISAATSASGMALKILRTEISLRIFLSNLERAVTNFDGLK